MRLLLVVAGVMLSAMLAGAEGAKSCVWPERCGNADRPAVEQCVDDGIEVHRCESAQIVTSVSELDSCLETAARLCIVDSEIVATITNPGTAGLDDGMVVTLPAALVYPTAYFTSRGVWVWDNVHATDEATSATSPQGIQILPNAATDGSTTTLINVRMRERRNGLPRGYHVVFTGTSTSGDTDTLTDSGASFGAANALINEVVVVDSGLATEQVRRITASTGTSVDVTPAFDYTVNGGETYEVRKSGSLEFLHVKNTSAAARHYVRIINPDIEMLSQGASSMTVGQNDSGCAHFAIIGGKLYGSLAIDAKGSCSDPAATQNTFEIDGTQIKCNKLDENPRSIKTSGHTVVGFRDTTTYNCGQNLEADSGEEGVIYLNDVTIIDPPTSAFAVSGGGHVDLSGDVVLAGQRFSSENDFMLVTGALRKLDLRVRYNGCFLGESLFDTTIVAAANSDLTNIRLEAITPIGCDWGDTCGSASCTTDNGTTSMVSQRSLVEFTERATNGAFIGRGGSTKTLTLVGGTATATSTLPAGAPRICTSVDGSNDTAEECCAAHGYKCVAGNHFDLQGAATLAACSTDVTTGNEFIAQCQAQ
jgi:hypothetical protein